MIPTKPEKPFATYKWRWASFTPSEGLLKTEVYLGVLRAFAANNGKRNGDSDVLDALRIVQQETKTSVNLSRSGERNLIRNSGQYWKGPGLLEATSGVIELTDFGQQVAAGRVTDSEFALTVVKTLTLPNPRIDSEEVCAQWKAANLEIKPLDLILAILGQLRQGAGEDQSYLTANELIQIVIPLAGVPTSVTDYADALLAYRAGNLSIADWPDCAPAANDKRMAHEFLLFLGYHGLCNINEDSVATRYDAKFFLVALEASDVIQFSQITAPNADAVAALKDVRKSQLPAMVEAGQRVLTTVLARPAQARFRREILDAYSRTCLLTGEQMNEVLEAAHIIPKSDDGADTANNGLCLRSDIHRLYDAGHIRFEPNGKLHFSDAVASSVSYANLPKSIQFPMFVTPAAVEWRWRYK